MAVRLDTAKLDKIILTFPKESADTVKEGAWALTAQARVIAPFDTGALHDSIGPPEEKSDLLYWVSDGVEYGIYHELKLGRGRRKPFMRPAVEKVQKQYTALWVALFNRL